MFKSIILIGPGTQLFPLTNSRLQITNLPILNRPLLEHNIEFLLPISKKIFVVILEENRKNIESICSKYNNVVQIVGIPCYDGIVASISRVGKMITSENLIVTKGDLITNIKIEDIAKKYLAKKSYFLSMLSETKNESITVGFREDSLLFYSTKLVNDFPDDLFTMSHVTLSKELDTVEFYMFKRLMLPLFDGGSFGLKQNLLPKIVEDLRNVNPVSLYCDPDAMIYQVKDKESYININKLLKLKARTGNNAIFDKSKQKEVKQYIKKNQLEDFTNYMGDVCIGEQCIVINSILGNEVTISNNTKVFSSIIMGNCRIGANCIIERCIIGFDVDIKPESTLIDCVVSSGYHFEDQIQGSEDIFNVIK